MSELRICGPDSGAILTRLLDKLEECEFDVPRHLVADIAVRGEPVREPDGSVRIAIEALTVASD